MKKYKFIHKDDALSMFDAINETYYATEQLQKRVKFILTINIFMTVLFMLSIGLHFVK